jgi:excinuclease UvrABC helicase subunit UvrB
MEAAISQTVRRRGVQREHNEQNGIVPKTIQKALPVMGAEIEDLVSGVAGRGNEGGKRMVAKPPGKKGLEGLAKRFGLGAGVWNNSDSVLENVSQPEWTEHEVTDSAGNDGEADVVSRLELEMRQAAERLDFERAAELRDRIYRIRNTTN